MSLEKAIADLNQTVTEQTIAIRDLIAVLKQQGYALASQPGTRMPDLSIPGFDTPTVPETLSAATGASEQDPAPTKSAAKPVPKVEQPAPESKAEVTYAEAAAEVTKLSRAKGRDAAVALLARFNAAKLPEVAPERYADVVAAVAAELTEQAA